MEEIQVGEYCRTLSGIFKFTKETESIYAFERNGKIFRIVKPDNLNKYVIKHSKNIIDLIEKDDYINGCRVYEIEEKGITVYQKVENSNIDYNWIAKDEIETILTHEQYKNNCYRIGE